MSWPVSQSLGGGLIFIPHTGLAGCRTKLDAFAEHLANGLSVKEAGAAVGKDYAAANAMMQVIRKRLGKQAR